MTTRDRATASNASAAPKRVAGAFGDRIARIACGVAVMLSTAWVAPAFGVVTLRVMTSDAAPGGSLPLILGIERSQGDATTASTQLDLVYSTGQLALPGFCSNGGAPCETREQCGEGACELLCDKDGRLTAQDFNATFPEFQNVGPGEKRVRLRLLAPIQGTLPLPSFDDGILATCMFDVDANAALGPITLSAQRVEVGDEESNVVPAEVVIDAGSIVDGTRTATPTETATATPDASMTPTETPDESPTPTAPMPTATPTVGETIVVPTLTPTTGPTTAVPTTTATSTAEPTNTPPVATPTLTPTTTPAETFTPTRPAASPTSSKPSRTDDDSCAVVPRPAGSRGGGIAWLLVPLAIFASLGRGKKRRGDRV